MQKSVYMLISGAVIDGEPVFSPFVAVQARSVERAGWKVVVGLIDDRTTVRGVLRNLKRMRHDIPLFPTGVVHAQYGSMVSLIAALSRGEAPLIVSFGGADLVGAKNPGIRWFLRDTIGRAFSFFSAQRSSAVVVKSENLYLSLPHWLRRKTIILPNGVDVDVFRPLDKAECRAKLGWPYATKVVLFNASKADNRVVKNPELAKAALEIARKTFPSATLHQISDLPHAEVAAMMSAADCLLLTSLSEGSPNIVKEAMACNLPVVGVPCGDVIERVKYTSPGGIYPYHPLFLGEALIKVFHSHRRSNGREQLQAQGLTARQVTEKLLTIYTVVQEHSENIQKDLSALCVE